MDTTYTKLDLGYLIDSDWSAIEDYFRIDDSGIWLLEESAPELRWLTQDERDLFMIHPDANPNFPVLPFPFTMKQFLKFADLPATELHDSYLFADDTVDVVAIERLERMYAPSGALARALMFGELPKLAQLKEIQGEAASAHAAPVVQATETKEQRQDRRLKACIDAGLPMNEKAASLRLPYGVANIAKSEGVTRQAFSTDVKAALNRRDNAKREGVTVHRT